MIRTVDILKELKSYLGISLGLMIYSFGFTTMLVNAGIVSGGAGGISTLCYYGISDSIPVGVYYFIVNAILIAIGVFTIGPNFGAKTIYAIIFNSFCLSIMQLYIPSDILGMDIEVDKLILAILGGVCAGLGISICFSQGGSSGGTDIVAMILNKYFGFPLGRSLMCCDIFIVSSSFFVFHEIRPIVYGFVTMAVVAYSIDSFMSGAKQSLEFQIFSSKYKEIGDKIVHEAGRGVTYLSGQGGFTGNDTKIVLVICHRNQQSRIYGIVKEVDPNAFVTVNNVSGVYGEGFEMLKNKK